MSSTQRGPRHGDIVSAVVDDRDEDPIEGVLELRYVASRDYVHVIVRSEDRYAWVDPSSVELIEARAVEPAEPDPEAERFVDLHAAMRDGLVMPVREREGGTWAEMEAEVERVAEPLVASGWFLTGISSESDSSYGDTASAELERNGLAIEVEPTSRATSRSGRRRSGTTRWRTTPTLSRAHPSAHSQHQATPNASWCTKSWAGWICQGGSRRPVVLQLPERCDHRIGQLIAGQELGIDLLEEGSSHPFPPEDLAHWNGGEGPSGAYVAALVASQDEHVAVVARAEGQPFVGVVAAGGFSQVPRQRRRPLWAPWQELT